MKSPVMTIRATAASDVGRVREGNEDSYFAGKTVFAVADGMGGHQAGEVASAMALRPIAELDGQRFGDVEELGNRLADAIRRSNDEVVERSRGDESLRGMGTTLTAAAVQDDRLVLAHVGDSRAYLIRPDDTISQLTTDHTLVERLVREGRLSRDEVAAHPQRNVITRAIGNDPDVAVDTLPPLHLQPGDMVLLCSDGLTGPVDDDDIQTLVTVTGGGEDAVDALIGAANEAGGPDNITVVLIEVAGAVATAGPSDDIDGSAAADATQVTTVAPVDGTAADEDVAAEQHDEGPRREVHHIRTTSTSEENDWASTMGRLGARQGKTPVAQDGSPRGRRLLAGVLAAVVLLGLLAGGAYLLLSRAYFVGEYEGQVAVYRGLPETVAGVPLYWVVEDQISDVPVDDLPDFRQQDVVDGLSAGTLREAEQVVNVLRRQVEESGTDPPADADPAPTDSAGS